MSAPKFFLFSSCRLRPAWWTAVSAQARQGPTYTRWDTFHPGSTYGKVRKKLLTPILQSHPGKMTVVHRFDSGVEILRVVQKAIP
jgi:hypothetical protein